MQRLRWLLFAAAIFLAIGAFVWWHRPPAALTAPEVRPFITADKTASVPILGVGACAGRSCHGSPEPLERTTSWQMEYTLWSQRDPHERAYRILLEKPAQDMARRLDISDGKAHESPLCLSCHTSPAAAHVATDAAEATFLRRERTFGVGCESCHGAAPRWLDAHVSKEWTTKTARQKSDDHGLTALSDPATLVKTCAGCHVGAPPKGDTPVRDVNHDLIAAGHPRLMFEASSFLANLPPHWKSKPRNESQLWAIGQVVSAEAALELLQHRAEFADAPWPEFAEYDCAACHHDLIAPSNRQRSGPHRLGAFAWGTWYFSMPQLLAMENAPGPLTRLTELARHLERPMPSRKAVGELLPSTRAELQKLRDRLSTEPFVGTIGKGFAGLMDRLPKQDDVGWDVAEQLFLAAHALSSATADKGRIEQLQELLDERRWPPRSAFYGPGFLRKLRANR